MAVPYPSSPAVGDSFTYAGITYTWNGVAWTYSVFNTPATVGSVAVTAPITNSGTPTAPVIGINQSALTIAQSQVTDLVSDLAGKASTSDLTTGLALKANLAGGNTFTGNQTFQNDITHNNFYQNFSNMLTSGRMTIGLSTLSSGVQLGVYSTSATNVGAIVRGAASQSANLQEWQNSSSTVLARIASTGQLLAPSIVGTAFQITAGGIFSNGATSAPANVQAYFLTTAATNAGLVVRGAASQTANLLELQNTSGTVMANFDPSGFLNIPNASLRINTAGASYGARIQTNTDGVGVIGQVIRATSGQTANLQEWQNSAGSIIARVDNVGDITARVLRSTFAARIQTNDAQTAVIVSTAAANQSADHLQYQNSAGTVLGGTTANGLQYIGSATSLRFLNYGLTAASASSTTVATYTTNIVSTVNPVVVGQKIIVSGVTPSSYNGSFNVTAIGGSSGAWTVTVTAPSAPFVVGSATGFGSFSVDTGLSIQIPSAGTPGLIIRAVASQAANIFEYRRSDNSLQTYITPAGDFVAPAISAIWSMTSSAQDVTVTALRARTSVASGYRANLQTWESSTTVLAGMTAAGKFFTGSTTGINSAIGGTIQSIATGANPLVTMASAHGLAVGDVVVLAGTTGGTYNGVFFVATVPASTTFTITSALTTGQAAAGGTVSVGAQTAITARSAGVKGLVIQGAASQTANLFEVLNSAGSSLARVESSGNFIISGIGVTSGDHRVGTSSYFSAALNVLARATTEIGIVVRGQASQTADLLQLQNSSGTVIADFSADGALFVNNQTTTSDSLLVQRAGSTHFRVDPFNNGFATGTFTVGANSTAGSIQAGIYSSSATNVALLVRGAASQSADLLQIQDSAATNLVRVNSSGFITTVAGLSATGNFLNSFGGDVITGATLSARAGSSSAIPLIVRGAVSQSVDLFQVQNSAGTVFASISFFGGFTVNSSLSITGSNSPISLQGSAGFSGQVLTSAGSGSTPYWSDPTTYTFASGTTNGAFTVTPSGGSPQSVPIFGLGTAAYRNVPASGNASSTEVVLGNDTRLTAFTGGTLTSDLVLAAGSGTVEPLTFQTNSATPVTTSGAMDYDGTVFYQTSNTNPGRALATQDYYYISNSQYTIDLSTAGLARSILGANTTGITLAAGTTYDYEVMFAMQGSFVLTSQTPTLALTTTTVSGSPSVSHFTFVDSGTSTTSFTAGMTMSSFRITTTQNLTPLTAGNRFYLVKMRGRLNITGTGTVKIYPSLSPSAGSSSNTWTIETGAMFRLTPIGNGTVTTVGAWA